MARKYIVAEDIKSETKVGKSIYIFDMFFIIIYFAVSLVLANMVNPVLKIPFYIYSVVCAVFLTGKSPTNKKRRNYESMIMFLRKDRDVYEAVKDISHRTEETLKREKINGKG